VDSKASRIHTVVNHTVAVAADTCLEPCVEVGMDSSMVVVGSDPDRALVHPMAAVVAAVAVEEEEPDS
jgi:hypothetical protein